MEKEKSSNRYLIYKLLRHHVKVEANGLGKKVKVFNGVVEKVMRDVFENQIVLTVSGKQYAYDEPAAIVQKDDCIVFLYGDIGDLEESDDELFQDMRAKAYGENVNDILQRTAPTCVRSIRFEIGEQAISKSLWGRRN